MNPDLILYTRRSGDAVARADRLSPSEWHRIRRGAYYPKQEWDRLDTGARHRALILTSATLSKGDFPCLSHVSAAHWWGLPVLGGVPNVVDVRVEGQSRSSKGILRVHRVPELGRVVRHNGLRVTDLATTVCDLARRSTVREALVTADAALRSGGLEKTELLEVAGSLPAGHSGRTKALHAARLADARAESPLESLSRAVMFRHRLTPPDLQVSVRVDGWFVGRADFGWPGLVGECDGAMKYGADLSGGDPSAAVLREKQREDEMRRVVDVVRWGWRHAYEEKPLVRLLVEKGLERVPLEAWLGP